MRVFSCFMSTLYQDRVYPSCRHDTKTVCILLVQGAAKSEAAKAAGVEVKTLIVKETAVPSAAAAAARESMPQVAEPEIVPGTQINVNYSESTVSYIVKCRWIS